MSNSKMRQRSPVINNDWVLLDCALEIEEYYMIENFLIRTYKRVCPRKVQIVSKLLEKWSGNEPELLRQYCKKYKLLRSDIPFSVRKFMERPPPKEPSPEPIPFEVREREKELALRNHFAELHRNFLRVRKTRPQKKNKPRTFVPIDPFARPRSSTIDFDTPEKLFSPGPKKSADFSNTWRNATVSDKNISKTWIKFNNITKITPHALIGDIWYFQGHFGRRPDFLRLEFASPAGDVGLALKFGARHLQASCSMGGRNTTGHSRQFDSVAIRGFPSVDHKLGHYEKFFIRIQFKKRGFVVSVKSHDKANEFARLQFAHRLPLEGIMELKVIKCDTRTNVYGWQLKRKRDVPLERQERQDVKDGEI